MHRPKLIQLLTIAGTPSTCYSIETQQQADQICKLYQHSLLKISTRAVVPFEQPINPELTPLEEHRYIVTKSQAQRDVLTKVEPVRLYVRFHDMRAQVMEVNPYLSVGWLRDRIAGIRGNTNTYRLFINEAEMTEDSESLIRYIHQNCIINAVEKLGYSAAIEALHFKQPNPEAEILTFAQVSTAMKIEQLAREVASKTGIPYQNLFLVYAGRLLPKERHLSEYQIKSGTVIYAVDSRKYMRKITKKEHQTRLSEIRTVKPSNRAVLQFYRQEQEAKQKQAQDELLQSIKRQSASKEKPFTTEQQVDYFHEEQEMAIDSEQLQVFSTMRPGLEQQQGTITPPNTPTTPIETLIDRVSSMQQSNQQLKEGRLFTKEQQKFTDQYGLVHEHTVEKSVFKNGNTRVQDTDVLQNAQGRIVKVEQDLVELSKDDQTGWTTRLEADIEQNADGSNRKVVTSAEVLDAEGRTIRSETSVVETRVRAQEVKKQEIEIVEQAGQVTQVSTKVVNGPDGPKVIETDIAQIAQDDQGSLIEYSKDIKEENGVTTVIQRRSVTDLEGNLVSQDIDVVTISSDEQGHVYKHQRNQRDDEQGKRVIERDLVTDQSGNVISDRKDVRVVEQVQGGEAVGEANFSQAAGQNATSEAHEHQEQFDSQRDLYEVGSKQFAPPEQVQQVQIFREHPAAIVVQGQPEPLINGGTEVSIDEQGFLHTHEKQLIEKQGKTTFVDRETVKDPTGKVVRVETDIVEIEGDDEGNMHKHKSQTIEEQGKVTMIESDLLMDPDGVALVDETDTIELENGEDGSLFKHEKDVIKSDGITKIIERNIIEDADGNVVRQQTIIKQYEDNSDTANIQQRQEIVEVLDPDQHSSSSLEKAQGGILRESREVSYDQQGQRVVQCKTTIENAEGQIVKSQTEVVRVQAGEDNQSEVCRQVTEYGQQGDKVVVTHSHVRQSASGEVLGSNSQIVELEGGLDGCVSRRQTEVTEQGGHRHIHCSTIVEDGQGIVTSEVSSRADKPMSSKGRVQENVDSVVVGTDEFGNVTRLETVVTVMNGVRTILERTIVQDAQGNITSCETNISRIAQENVQPTLLTKIDSLEQQQLSRTRVPQTNQEYGNIEWVSSAGDATEVVLTDTKVVYDVQPMESITSEWAQDQNQIADSAIREAMGNIQKEIIDHFSAEGQQSMSAVAIAKELFTLTQSQTEFDAQAESVEASEASWLGTGYYNNQLRLVSSFTDIGKVEEPPQLPEAGDLIESLTVHREGSQREQPEVCTNQVDVTVQKQGDFTKTHKVETISGQGTTTVIQTDTIQDEQGNTLSQNTTKLVIEQSPEAVAQQARRIAIAEVSGEITDRITQSVLDDQGNKHSHLQQTIEQHGKTIKLSNETIEGPQGELIRSFTKISMRARVGDDRVESSETEITEKEGQIRVVAYTEVRDSESMLLDDSQGQEVVSSYTQPQQYPSEQILTASLKNVQPDGFYQSARQQFAQQLSQGSSLRHEHHTTEGEDSHTRTSTETVAVVGPTGETICEKSRTVEVEQSEGLYKIKTTEIVQHPGVVEVVGMEVLEDEDGNVIDSKSSRFKLDESAQGVEREVLAELGAVAEAEIQGRVGKKSEVQGWDEQGNVHIRQQETIENQGAVVYVDNQVVETQQGQVLQVQTHIIREHALGHGKIQTREADIIDSEGKVRFMEYTEVKDDEQRLQSQLKSSQKSEGQAGRLRELRQLLGFSENDESSENITFRAAGQAAKSMDMDLLLDSSGTQDYTMSKDNRTSHDEVNLLDDSLANSDKKIGDLPLQSKKQLVRQMTPTFEAVEELQAQPDQEEPLEYNITVYDKLRRSTSLKIRYDEIIDEVAEKLSQQIGVPKDSIKFFKDGNELAEYEMVSDLDIRPNEQLYYLTRDDF